MTDVDENAVRGAMGRLSRDSAEGIQRVSRGVYRLRPKRSEATIADG